MGRVALGVAPQSDPAHFFLPLCPLNRNAKFGTECLQVVNRPGVRDIDGYGVVTRIITREQLFPEPDTIDTSHARDLVELLNEQRATAISLIERVEEHLHNRSLHLTG
jgi:hypothetical protein